LTKFCRQNHAIPITPVGGGFFAWIMLLMSELLGQFRLHRPFYQGLAELFD
jgi:hypothetical protein